MLKRTAALLLAAFLLAACGGSTEPSIDMDGKSEVAKGDAKDATGEVCTPECGDKKCGSDGCQGTCGTCDPWLECNDSGQCVAPPCVSSKDCPGELVCDEEAGSCVVCVQDGDCAEEETCGADHLCHGVVACTSDKDCKDYDMLCDLDAGVCVQCLKSAHCAEDEYCVDSYCLPDACVAGESWCEENQVLACSDDGGAGGVVETCGAEQYCEEAACHDYLCEPAVIWCDGDVLKTCSEDGKSIASEVDCSASEQHCFDGQCIDSVCIPEGTKCSDDFTVGVCDADGMGFTQELCPGQHLCEEGACMPWECTPSEIICEGAVAVTCDYKGKKVAEVDCEVEGKVCADGSCVDLTCTPGADLCIDVDTIGHCSEDGLLLESEDCPGQHSCLDGACHAWTCTPGTGICDGAVATVCDVPGLGPVPGGTDCEPLGKFCVDGECIECQPQCVGKECGLDGCGGSCGECLEGQLCINGECPAPGFECDDGNDVDWDGCTDGMLTEFRISDGEELWGDFPALDSFQDGRFVVVWAGPQGGDTNDGGIVARLFNADGSFFGGFIGVNSQTSSLQTLPAVATLDESRFVAAWSTTPGDWNKTDVHARLFEIGGVVSPVTDEFLVHTTTAGKQYWPAVASLPGGGFVVVWEGSAPNSNHRDMFGQLFNADGQKVGPEFQLNTFTSHSQHQGAVAAAQDGGFFAIWTSQTQSGFGAAIAGSVFSAEGTPTTGEIMVDSFPDTEQQTPDIASLAGGDLVAVWTAKDNDGSEFGIYGQHLASDGTKIGTDFLVNIDTVGSQFWPKVASFAGGGFVAVWQDAHQNDLDCIEGRLFDAAGEGSDEQISPCTFTIGSQSEPDVEALKDDTFIVVWHSNPNDQDEMDGIFAQRFDAEGNKLYH